MSKSVDKKAFFHTKSLRVSGEPNDSTPPFLHLILPLHSSQIEEVFVTEEDVVDETTVGAETQLTSLHAVTSLLNIVSSASILIRIDSKNALYTKNCVMLQKSNSKVTPQRIHSAAKLLAKGEIIFDRQKSVLSAALHSLVLSCQSIQRLSCSVDLHALSEVFEVVKAAKVSFSSNAKFPVLKFCPSLKLHLQVDNVSTIHRTNHLQADFQMHVGEYTFSDVGTSKVDGSRIMEDVAIAMFGKEGNPYSLTYGLRMYGSQFLTMRYDLEIVKDSYAGEQVLLKLENESFQMKHVSELAALPSLADFREGNEDLKYFKPASPTASVAIDRLWGLLGTKLYKYFLHFPPKGVYTLMHEGACSIDLQTNSSLTLREKRIHNLCAMILTMRAVRGSMTVWTRDKRALELAQSSYKERRNFWNELSGKLTDEIQMNLTYAQAQGSADSENQKSQTEDEIFTLYKKSSNRVVVCGCCGGSVGSFSLKNSGYQQFCNLKRTSCVLRGSVSAPSEDFFKNEPPAVELPTTKGRYIPPHLRQKRSGEELSHLRK